jgi:hypothetical protein
MRVTRGDRWDPPRRALWLLEMVDREASGNTPLTPRRGGLSDQASPRRSMSTKTLRIAGRSYDAQGDRVIDFDKVFVC